MADKRILKKYQNEQLTIKKKLFIALALLLILSTVMVAVSFAWFTMSAKPTVEGVNTTIASNGALEIALLSSGTYDDPSLIESGIGYSLDIPDSEEANLRWGNLVDLSSEVYGLDKIDLYPSMLNLKRHLSGAVTLESNILKVPVYGPDGRVMELDANSVSGVYSDGSFTVNANRQTHGVRAIGTAAAFTLQQKALLSSRSALISSDINARQAAKSLLRKYDSLFNRMIENYALYLHDYNDPAFLDMYSEQDVIDIATDITSCLDTIEYSIRQGLIAIVASEMTDEAQFEMAYNILSNTDIPMNRALNNLPYSFSGSLAIANWISEIEEQKQIMEEIISTYYVNRPQCVYCFFNYTNPNKLYIGEYNMDEINETNYARGAGITVMPYSGSFSFIADYVGNYNNGNISVRTENSNGYLALLEGIATNLSADNDEASVTEIDDICGYAIDLAFRCNADDASLLLLTEPVEGENAFGDIETVKNGSYLEFRSKKLDEKTLVELMDAFRVTFVDSNGNVLGIAKLNTSNYESVDSSTFRARLYLYEYYSRTDSIVTGERQDDLSTLVALPRNIPVIVSAVVWLDGDAVSNSMAAVSGTSVTAVLNLQFATDVELVPSDTPDQHENSSHLGDETETETEDEPETIVPEGELIDSGVCGENVTWALYENGVLEISGTGEMYDYSDADIVPWKDYKTYIKASKIDDGVTSIGVQSFNGCTSLTNVEIPNSVTSIGHGVFCGCSSLTSINIPEGVTSIGIETFYFCLSLTSIDIPESVTSIGNSAFCGCYSLTSVVIPDGVTSIGDSAFTRCIALTSIEIPDGVTSIGHGAFDGCTSLTSIDIPDGLTSIGDSTFRNCSSLTSIDIPDSVTSIGYYSFGNCTSLINISISDSVTSIGNLAFDSCTSLTDVYYSGTIDQWNSITIKNYNEPLYSATIHCTNGVING